MALVLLLKSMNSTNRLLVIYCKNNFYLIRTHTCLEAHRKQQVIVTKSKTFQNESSVC